MDFKNLEDVATFMLVNIRLSRYDLQFVNNLTNIIGIKNIITTNQDALFKKITRKYNRQFNQQKFDVETLLKLTWQCNIVHSSPQYTNASISIVNDEIIFRSPFNKNFLSAIRKKPIYSMEWQKDKREYRINYGPTALKDLISISADYFDAIDYCYVTRQIIDSLIEYENIKYWVPTLVYKNGHFYVAACNEILYEQLKDIPLTNDLKMIADYVRYGVNINSTVIDYFSFEDYEKVMFATQYNPNVELSDLPKVFEWLRDLGCDVVTEPFRPSAKLFLYTEPYQQILDQLNIDIGQSQSNLLSYQKPAMIHHRTYGFNETQLPLFKMIKCVNSEPVNLGNK